MPILVINRDFFRRLRASNFELNILTSPKFELIPDFTPVLNACNYLEVPIRTEIAIARALSNVSCFSS